TREDPLEPADRPGEGEPVLGPYDPVRGVLREARASDVRSVPSHARDEAAAVRLDRPGPGDDLRRAAQGAPDLLDDGRRPRGLLRQAHDRLPGPVRRSALRRRDQERSEEHTSELQSRFDLVCRLLLEKKNTT